MEGEYNALEEIMGESLPKPRTYTHGLCLGERYIPHSPVNLLVLDGLKMALENRIMTELEAKGCAEAYCNGLLGQPIK